MRSSVTWGILLADVATHVANALEETEGADRDAEEASATLTHA